MPDLLRKLPRWSFGSQTSGGGGPVVADRTPGATERPGRRSRSLPSGGSTSDEAAAFWQAAPVAVALVATEGLVACNPACRALLGQVVGDSPAQQRRWLEAAVVRMLVAGLETEVLAAGPERALSVEVRLGGATDGEGRRIVVLREIAERTTEREELAELVGTLGHEFRTPLTSMKNSLNLILEEQTGPLTDDQKHFLIMTRRNIDRLERLVADVLDLSRPETTPSLRRRDVDLGRLLREALADHMLAASRTGLTCDTSGVPEHFQAHVDPDKIVQIVDNVVGNALKYTPEGGLVRVWLEQRSTARSTLAQALAEQWFLPLNAFSLVVEDNGPGLSAADLDRVFDPFFRAAGGMTATVPGAGLGLHITRGLVEAHGGSIRLMSRPGQGTTAWVRMPQDRESEHLLLAAARLESALGNLPATAKSAGVAVLDLRREGLGQPAGALVRRFYRECSGLRGGRAVGAVSPPIVDLASGLVAVITDDVADLNEAWQAYLADHPGAEVPADSVWQEVVCAAEPEAGHEPTEAVTRNVPGRCLPPA